MNNNNKYWVAISAAAVLQFPLHAFSQNIIRSPAPVSLTIEHENWLAADPQYSSWVNSGEASNCKSWLPGTETVPINQVFQQIANDCEQAQTRTLQPREQSSQTQAYRNVGERTTEHRLISASKTREAIGTQESWLATSPILTAWVNEGSVYDCQTWSPSPTTVTVGQAFTQQSDDCKIKQTRTRQDREQEAVTLAYRNVGSLVNESQVIAASSSRQSVGSKETWIAATPVYSLWSNSSSVYGCTNWSPDPSTVNSGVTFTQNATDCKIDQTRTRQNREQESTTLVYRSIGGLVTESQTLPGQSNSRQAIGTKTAKVCKYDRSFNPNFDSYYTNTTYAFIWTSGYSTVPAMIIDAKTGKNGWDQTAVPGLSRVSNTEFKYNDGNKIWTMTRGAYKAAEGGYSYYEICYQ